MTLAELRAVVYDLRRRNTPCPKLEVTPAQWKLLRAELENYAWYKSETLDGASYCGTQIIVKEKPDGKDGHVVQG